MAGSSARAGAGGTAGSSNQGGASGTAGSPIILEPEPQPPADLTPELFRARFAALRCSQLARCCDPPFEAATCSARAYDEWAAREQPAEPATFNRAAAAHCLKHLAEAGCSDRSYFYCEAVYQELSTRGESCDLTHRCEPSLAGDVQCLDDRCVLFWERIAGETCVGDYTNELGAYSTSYSFVRSIGRETELAMCPKRNALECVDGVCTAIAGEACYTATCAEDEYCSNEQRACIARPRAGEPATGPCYESFADPATDECAPLTPNGRACFTNATCESGYCSLDSSCGEPSAEFCGLGR